MFCALRRTRSPPATLLTFLDQLLATRATASGSAFRKRFLSTGLFFSHYQLAAESPSASKYSCHRRCSTLSRNVDSYFHFGQTYRRTLLGHRIRTDSSALATRTFGNALTRTYQPTATANKRKMHYHPLALLATTAFVFFSPPRFASSQASTEMRQQAKHPNVKEAEGGAGRVKNACLFYGCPLLPHDVHYSDDAIKEALTQLRSGKRVDADPRVLDVLRQAINDDAVTLTLIGYKGGKLAEQINQDRAMVVAPYYVSPSTEQGNQPERILQGVFDGHAPLGERVAEYVAQELPALLASKLQDHEEHAEEEMDATSRALSETFVELDQLVPGHPSGGCTATVVLKQGGKIYVANSGDSRSFIVTYRSSTGMTEIVYMTREDKPELPEEKARVEAAGGQVYIPIKGTSRVVYQDPNTGVPTGLAMSRSIGDWAAGKKGVIPDPIVHVLDINTLVATQLSGNTVEIDERGVVTMGGANEEDALSVDDVYIVAISATDGMMDYMHEGEIAKIITHALFDSRGVHPASACEHLVFSAAQSWQEAKQGRYRDDIAIAVSTLRRPPSEMKDVPKQ